ncbi:MAG TPA: asparagine synthase (glutamine-hydrolyzing) [Phnomibacter sp.]|nr:asparagine synthase (glutamine-hydrolyzing) [Phnomibacter sp.]
MCGIAGYIDYTGNGNREVLASMTDAMLHRGPDDKGYETFDCSGAHVGLGQRRLSIIDLSPLGHQPMFDDTGKHAIIFNGEVYNYQTVAEKLKQRGIRFKSNSDTEVILYALREFGVEAVQSFIGMFAIVYLDVEAGKILLIRDRAGVKPFYYAFKPGQYFIFGSELKALFQFPSYQKRLNTAAIADYLRYGYFVGSQTVFQHTFKINPGSYIQYDLAKKSFEEKKYWDVADCYKQPKQKMDEAEAVHELDKLLTSAFDYRMIADVPVGLFLSGGYDSTTLAAVLQKNRTEKIKTYTIGFEFDSYNEAPFAKALAAHIGTEHTEAYCTTQDAIDIIPKLSDYFDEPFGDASSIPTYLVSHIAAKHVTVVLSADAGDEVFGGYNRYGYLLKYRNGRMAKLPEPVKELAGTALRSSGYKSWDAVKKRPGLLHKLQLFEKMSESSSMAKQNLSLIGKFSDSEIAALLSGVNEKIVFENSEEPYNKIWENGALGFDDILVWDYQNYLADDIFTKVDRCTMSASIEGREPYADQRIIEFMAGLPFDMKIKGTEKKWLLKKVAHQYIPPALLDRPKIGFGVPLEHWFMHELKDLVNDYLSSDSIQQTGVFNKTAVLQLLSQFRKYQTPDSANKLWLIFTFEMWYKRWMS